METLITDRAPLAPQQTLLDFERLYLALRQAEGRVYTDDEVKNLPRVSNTHLFKNEWHLRARSCSRLAGYLLNKKRALNILEVGCGNGWLSAKLAAVPLTQVAGIDVNHEEITQARRIFKKSNLKFLCCPFDDLISCGQHFDMIVFAASLPYFANIEQVLQQASGMLKTGGEIHITDTHFYQPAAVGFAARRCLDYYHKLGFPAMAAHYHHHTLDAFINFRHDILLNPAWLLPRLRKEPFYWIRVQKASLC